MFETATVGLDVVVSPDNSKLLLLTPDTFSEKVTIKPACVPLNGVVPSASIVVCTMDSSPGRVKSTITSAWALDPETLPAASTALAVRS